MCEVHSPSPSLSCYFRGSDWRIGGTKIGLCNCQGLVLNLCSHLIARSAKIAIPYFPYFLIAELRHKVPNLQSIYFAQDMPQFICHLLIARLRHMRSADIMPFFAIPPFMDIYISCSIAKDEARSAELIGAKAISYFLSYVIPSLRPIKILLFFHSRMPSRIVDIFGILSY